MKNIPYKTGALIIFITFSFVSTRIKENIAIKDAELNWMSWSGNNDFMYFNNLDSLFILCEHGLTEVDISNPISPNITKVNNIADSDSLPTNIDFLGEHPLILFESGLVIRYSMYRDSEFYELNQYDTVAASTSSISCLFVSRGTFFVARDRTLLVRYYEGGKNEVELPSEIKAMGNYYGDFCALCSTDFTIFEGSRLYIPKIGGFHNPNETTYYDFAVHQPYIYLLTTDNRIQIIDLSIRSNPTLVGNYTLPFSIGDTARITGYGTHLIITTSMKDATIPLAVLKSIPEDPLNLSLVAVCTRGDAPEAAVKEQLQYPWQGNTFSHYPEKVIVHERELYIIGNAMMFGKKSTYKSLFVIDFEEPSNPQVIFDPVPKSIISSAVSKVFHTPGFVAISVPIAMIFLVVIRIRRKFFRKKEKE